MKIILFAVLPLLFIQFEVQCQVLSSSIISSGGDEDLSESIALSWTIGEIAVKSQNIGDRLLTEGFHQPELQVVEIAANGFHDQNEIISEGSVITVYPNPVTSTLIIHVESEKAACYDTYLFDLSGKLLFNTIEEPSTEDIKIDLSSFVPGMYLLYLSEANQPGKYIYKITKL